MKMSIVIPTYNKLEYLKLTLYSFCNINFTFDDFEIIVCDDGSTCPVNSICEMKLPFHLRLLSLPRRGRAYARNVGISKAKGEVIIFNDDDSIVDPDFLLNHWERHKENDRYVLLGERRQLYLTEENVEALVRGNIKEMDTCIMKYSKSSIFNSQVTEKLFKKNTSRHWICSVTANMSIRALWLRKLGAFDENFKGWGLEDMELGYRLSRNGFLFYYEPLIRNYHIEHPRNRREMIEDMQKNIEYFYHKYDESEDIHLFWEFYNGRISLKEFDYKTIGELDKESEDTYFTLFNRSNLKPLKQF